MLLPDTVQCNAFFDNATPLPMIHFVFQFRDFQKPKDDAGLKPIVIHRYINGHCYLFQCNFTNRLTHNADISFLVCGLAR